MKGEEMMYYKTFDTHKYIKDLQETGFNEKQAETLVKSLLASRDFDLSILATRDQVTKLDSKIDKVATELDAKIDKVATELDAKIDKVDSKIDNVESSLREEISSAKYDILKWIIPLILTNIAMIASVIVKLFY